jgi:hypothetical protein
MKVRAMFIAVLPATAAVLALSASGASATTISGAVHHAAARKSSVVIRKIWYNSPGSDTGSNASLNHEWVKLHNRTGFPVTMTGWTLRDAKHHVFTFGTYTLQPHSYVKIHTGSGTRTQANRYWGHSWYIWNNTGDTATLERPSGKVKSRCSYSDPHERRALKVC